MTRLTETIDRVTSLYGNSSQPPDQLQQAVYTVIQLANNAASQDIEEILRRLNPLMGQGPLIHTAIVAIGCGTLIERGANPDIVSTNILRRTLEALQLAPGFVAACQEAARNDSGATFEIDPRDVEACVERYGIALARKNFSQANAWYALDSLCTAALAVLMRLPQARETTRQDSEFMAALEACPEYNAGVVCLHELLDLLENEELIVLEPSLKRGYHIRISGVHDNFQLHTLLADALIGDPAEVWLPGERPDPLVVAAAKDGPFPMPDEDNEGFPAAKGSFNLWNWQGLQPDGTLPKGFEQKEDWIWNEGKPADIEPFEGTRIILLGPPPYPRSWSAGRYFPGLPGQLEVLAQLSPEQVNDWLSRIKLAVTQA